jgi:hypothetical protein
MNRTGAAVLLAICISVFPVGALADRGGNDAPPSLTLRESNPHYDGTATFSVTYPDMRWSPRVRLLCFQNGQTVYQYSQGTDGSQPWEPAFHLWDAIWAENGGGAANCEADLFYYTWRGNRQTGVVYLVHREFRAEG